MQFMAKNLFKNIMRRSWLRNKLLKISSKESVKPYTKQRVRCVSLLKKAKKDECENLDKIKVSDKKLFWKSVKPSVSKKFNAMERISLNENDEIVKAFWQCCKDICNIFQ